MNAQSMLQRYSTSTAGAPAHSNSIIFVEHNVSGYVDGTIECPDLKRDSRSFDNWTQNNTHACSIMLNNIASSQLIHVKQCKTSEKMWSNLVMVHQSTRTLDSTELSPHALQDVS